MSYNNDRGIPLIFAITVLEFIRIDKFHELQYLLIVGKLTLSSLQTSVHRLKCFKDWPRRNHHRIDQSINLETFIFLLESMYFEDSLQISIISFFPFRNMHTLSNELFKHKLFLLLHAFIFFRYGEGQIMSMNKYLQCLVFLFL